MKISKKMAIAAALLCSGSIFTVGTTYTRAAQSEVVDQSNMNQQIIKQVTGIADVYGDGEKIVAAILEYPNVINPRTVSTDDFKVEGKIIEAIYVNDEPKLTDRNKFGKYIILKFKYENTAYEGDLSNRPNANNANRHDDNKRDDNKNNGSRGTEAPMRSDRKLPDLSFSVQQCGEIEALDGTVYSANDQLVDCTSVHSPIIDSFKQFVYTDSETGLSMPYNLYLPKDYNANKKYPLLLFIADASANINEVTTPLFQGNGATVFATPDEQTKHECIVLAPQYTADLVESIGMMTTDENVWTPGLTLVTNLLFDVINNYSVDKNRIYGTGQSQGGMANIAISDKYPDLFAAQYLVACQWNVDEMEVLKNKKLWITVCEGDTKAFPGMNEAVARWKSLGAKISRNKKFWNSKASINELNKNVKSIARKNANINYTVFAGGNHMYTWSFAYNIEAIRDWLFAQSKDD